MVIKMYAILVQYNIVLIVIKFLMIISISSVFIYFHWYSKRRYIETAIHQTYK